MKNKEALIHLFQENQGILRTSELLAAGVSENALRKLYIEGEVIKLKRGFYKWNNLEVLDIGNQWVDVQKMLPKGVFCLYSAAEYHELSTFIPAAFHIALPKNSSTSLFIYPPVQTYFWEESIFSIGIEEYEVEGEKVHIYNAERTVCDMLRFKHKVTWETAKECLKTYLNRKNRNIPLLLKYSESFRIKQLLSTYLDVLL